jgi:GT2 family glycosyltransferase
MTFGVTIPTYKREPELRRCVSSIVAQTVLPLELIVVDDDCLQVSMVDWMQQECMSAGVELRYYRKSIEGGDRGSSQSRNLALEKTSADAMVVLDDDIVLEPYFFSSLFQTWSEFEGAHLLGVGGIITNNRPIGLFERLFRWVFCLRSQKQWDVTGVGYQVWDDGIQVPTKGAYAHGGVFAYDVAHLKELGGFTVFSLGRNALEDVDFFLRAKQANLHTVVDPGARALHEHTPTARERSFVTGKKETMNRFKIYKMHGRKGVFGRLWFYWSTIGWILKTVMSLRFKKAIGMFLPLIRL